MISGIAIDLVIRDCRKTADEKHHHHDHEGEQGCEERLALAALRHTMEVFIYIAGISFLLNLGIAAIGEATLAGFFTSIPVLGEFLAALVGLIPNCASSVVITELYLSGVIGAGAMMSGLLVNAESGSWFCSGSTMTGRETAKIIAALYAPGRVLGACHPCTWSGILKVVSGGEEMYGRRKSLCDCKPQKKYWRS